MIQYSGVLIQQSQVFYLHLSRFSKPLLTIAPDSCSCLTGEEADVICCCCYTSALGLDFLKWFLLIIIVKCAFLIYHNLSASSNQSGYSPLTFFIKHTCRAVFFSLNSFSFMLIVACVIPGDQQLLFTFSYLHVLSCRQKSCPKYCELARKYSSDDPEMFRMLISHTINNILTVQSL